MFKTQDFMNISKDRWIWTVYFVDNIKMDMLKGKLSIIS
jgi:hypothetical protein